MTLGKLFPAWIKTMLRCILAMAIFHVGATDTFKTYDSKVLCNAAQWKTTVVEDVRGQIADLGLNFLRDGKDCTPLRYTALYADPDLFEVL